MRRENREVIIELEEYKELLKMKGRIEAFADFLKQETIKTSLVNKEDCASILGISLAEEVEQEGKLYEED